MTTTEGAYTNFAEITAALEKAGCEYLILRNYDELLSDDVFMAGHADIDMLCSNASEVARAICASPAHPQNADGIHYCIQIKGKKASVDLRETGDGYYCRKWQEEMLRKRVPYNGFYIMDPVNGFYSLVYHAILQKRSLSEEYRGRLMKAADGLGLKADGDNAEKSLLGLLEGFMKDNGYKYTFCVDKHVPLRVSAGINRSMLERDCRLQVRHFFYEARIKMIDLLVRIKHKIVK